MSDANNKEKDSSPLGSQNFEQLEIHGQDVMAYVKAACAVAPNSLFFEQQDGKITQGLPNADVVPSTSPVCRRINNLQK